jgi:protoporphyrinogen oxidase
LVEFPIQYNLNGLPLTHKYKSVKSILTSYFNKPNTSTSNFEKYSKEAFGNYLTDIFVRPYNEKLFGVSLSELTIDWFGDYIPVYSKTKMLASAFGISKNNPGRNSGFYYPESGGISEIATGICSKLKITPRFKSRLVSLSLKNKAASFSDGSEIRYEYLINTIPVKNLLEKIIDIPTDILNSSALLKKNSTTILHLLCKGQLKENRNHWIYIPDTSIPFYRVTLPGNICKSNCPENKFAVTLEIGGNYFKNESVLERCIKTLNRMNILNNESTVIDHYWKLLDCGYVIYDAKRSSTLDKIFSFLNSNNIWSVGRYGSWEYSNMEDAILHGKITAEKLLNIVYD